MSASVSTTLLKAGVPAVVAMQMSINDEAAIAFSSSFYSNLALGATVEEAVVLSRINIAANGLRDQEWGIPILYVQSADAATTMTPKIDSPENHPAKDEEEQAPKVDSPENHPTKNEEEQAPNRLSEQNSQEKRTRKFGRRNSKLPKAEM